jgi:hypothetical protein
MKTVLATTAGLILLCASLFTATSAQSSGGVSPVTERSNVPLAVSVAPREVETGSRITVAGGSGSAEASRVKLLFRDAGTTRWQPVKAVPTDGNGRFRTKVTAERSGALRTAVSSGRVSDIRKIRVRSRVKVKLSSHQVKLGRSLLIRGSVKPAGRRWIRINIKGDGRDEIKVRTKAHGGFKARWKPETSGNFRMRVRSADNSAALGDQSRRIEVMGMRPSGASYYGPGLYGNGVACGGTLMPDTLGVAHKTLPCGTKVTISYHGRTVTVPVIDRGPYVAGRDYDLTEATRNRLGFGGVGTIWTNH